MKNLKRHNFLLIFTVGFMAFLVGLGGMLWFTSNINKEVINVDKESTQTENEEQEFEKYVSSSAESYDLAQDAESERLADVEKEVVEDENRKVVQFNDNLSEQAIKDYEDKYQVDFIETESIKNTKSPVYTLRINETSDLNSLESDSNVSSVETDIPVRIFAQSIDWGVERIGATNVWETTTGSGVTVAVIDTGVQLDHSDLSSNLVSGYDFVNEDSVAYDDHGHGTHVAGIVSAVNNGYGVVGAGYSSKIMPIKALNSQGAGYLSDIVEGIYFAVENGADVINMSLGTTYDSSTMRKAVNYAYSNNVLVVAAAGNAGASNCAYPAGYSEVVCVMATDNENRLASFSNRGGEISAPGVSNYSTYLGSKYAYLSGTSMASPHVAGAAAMIMQTGVGSVSDVRALLNESAADLGDEGEDELFGSGLVDLVQAISPTEDEQPDEDNEIDEDETDQSDEDNEIDEDETDQSDESEDETNQDQDQDQDQSSNNDKKESQSPADNNNENARDPGVIMQKLNIQEPEDKRVEIDDEDIEEIDFIFSVEPYIETSKLERIIVNLNNKEVFSTNNQEGHFTWLLEDVEDGQYVFHFIAYYDKGQQHERVLVEVDTGERGRGRERVKEVLERRELNVKGVMDENDSDDQADKVKNLNFWRWLFNF